MAENAGAASDATTDPTSQAFFEDVVDRPAHSIAAKVPSIAQEKLLAEYHENVSVINPDRPNKATATRAVEVDCISRRTITPSRISESP